MAELLFTFDLQHFAVNATTNNTTGNDLSPEMQTFYDKTLIRLAGPKLVHAQHGQKRNIPKGNGKTVQFRQLSSAGKALTPLTEGVTPEGQSLDVKEITATVQQYGGYYTLSDLLTMTAVDNMIVETLGLCADQGARTIDTVVRDILQAGTNVTYCPKVAEGVTTEVTSRANLDKTSKLTLAVVRRVVAKLRAANAPAVIGGDYVAIVHPYVACDLMNDKHWEDVSKYTKPENLMAGEIGRIAGCRFVESSEAKIYTGTGCPSGLAVFGSLFFGKDAFGTTEIEGGGLTTIVNQLGSGGTADPIKQRATVGWKATCVAEILVPSYLVRVESTSEFSGTAQAN